MKILEFGHNGVMCSDLKQSAEFYEKVLGMERAYVIRYGDRLNVLRRRAAEEGRQLDAKTEAALTAKADKVWVVYEKIAGTAFVELFDNGGADMEAVQQKPHLGHQHLALIVEDIQAVRQHLLDCGAPLDVDVMRSGDGSYQLFTHDPDGNKIEIIQYSPNAYQRVGRPGVSMEL